VWPHFVSISIAIALLATTVSAQEIPDRADPVTQITVEGKQISGSDVLVRKGKTYVSVSALAQALGASVTAQGEVAVLSIPASSEGGCGDTPDTRRLSDTYRKAALRIPDEVESLRVLVSKQSQVIPAARFDEVERQISEAEFRAQTDADKSVSYALSHANSTLAIMYFKLRRGVPPEYAKEGQLDSVLCSMESKFALQFGRLSGKESCSVLQSKEAATSN
jgi:hypothetical protein